MKADMTQVSVYRGSRVRAQVRDRDGLESSFFFLSFFNITMINETNHTES